MMRPCAQACPRHQHCMHTMAGAKHQLLSRCHRMVSMAAAGHGSAGRQLLLTLERAVGPGLGVDAGLQGTNAFEYEVFPDLPIATTWQTLFKALSRPGGARESAADLLSYTVHPGSKKVITVAAQLRSMSAIEQRILSATADDASKPSTAGRPADALLCLSGSHPVRSLPLVPRLLRSSVDVLHAASRLRSQGRLPPTTQLWAVANPNREPDASLLERKADAGATTVLTQPPFEWDAFERWAHDADRRGVWQRVRLVVGHPMISSSSNLAFWLALSSCHGLPGARRLQERLSDAAAGGGAAGVEELCQEYARDLVAKAQQLPGVAGLHVMPITPKARSLALALLADGTLPACRDPKQPL